MNDLEKFGSHLPGCNTTHRGVCSCGLREALYESRQPPEPPKIARELVNVRELSKRLGRFGATITWAKTEAKAARIPSIKVGSRLLFDVEAVHNAILERAGESVSSVPDIEFSVAMSVHPSTLRRIAEKLRYVPGTYDIYDSDIDQLLEIASDLDPQKDPS